MSSTPSLRPVDTAECDQLLHGEHGHPHGLLGPHVHDGAVTVRVLKPLARTVTLHHDGHETPMTHEYDGIWVAAVPGETVPDYRVAVTYDDGPEQVVDDPYRFLPTLGETDLHLVNEGRHELLWRVLGARVHHYPSAHGTISGTSFAVWAPGARGLRVKGDFNRWDGREHPMRQLGTSGVWELFVPGIGTGTHYKYAVLGADGRWTERADPMAAYAEVPPLTASIVWESDYTWGDDAWRARVREADALREPMSIYELHLGSWRRHDDGSPLTWLELAEQVTAYVADLGFTHVELMPVMQHPYGGSWGYHVTSYYAPDSRFGDPDGLRAFIDTLHQAGIGVLLDWVPGHFATDPWALAGFDGTPLYEDPNPQRGWHKGWGSHIFNFGRNEVRNFLYANAVYWAEEFHADGLRVDAVASMLYLDYDREPHEWTPNVHGGRENLEAVQFLQEMNATVHHRSPGTLTIAEESTSWPGVTAPTSQGGLGFDLKWNMGWMNDTLRYLGRDPIHRSHHHGEITFSLVYAFSEHYVLPISHDEVVHGKGSLLRKMPGDRWQELASVRAFLAYMWAHPGKQLLFMGAEFGQESEWAESRQLDWWLLDHSEHRGLQGLVRDLNAAYAATPALWTADADPAGFTWLDADDAARNTFSFLRRDPATGETVACVANFSPVPHGDFHLGLPVAGDWEEIVNTDAAAYTGSGVGNLGVVTARPEPHHGQPASATLVVPPLATIWLRPADSA